MKTLRFFLSALFTIVFGVAASAQAHEHMNMDVPSIKTETFKVWGNCDMCKTRIEKAVKEDGATSAKWDMKTKMLTVTFNSSETSIDSFSKRLASIGHDTEKYKTDEKTYDALPDCCKYERTAQSMTADYTCTMHPEVHSDKPGKCPKCGMALVKNEKSPTETPKTQRSIEGMPNN